MRELSSFKAGLSTMLHAKRLSAEISGRLQTIYTVVLSCQGYSVSGKRLAQAESVAVSLHLATPTLARGHLEEIEQCLVHSQENTARRVTEELLRLFLNVSLYVAAVGIMPVS